MQTITLNVDDEVKALGDALAVAIVDVRAKAPVGQDITDVVGKLVPALTGIANFAGDIKKVDNQVSLIKALADALEPKPA